MPEEITSSKADQELPTISKAKGTINKNSILFSREQIINISLKEPWKICKIKEMIKLLHNTIIYNTIIEAINSGIS